MFLLRILLVSSCSIHVRAMSWIERLVDALTARTSTAPRLINHIRILEEVVVQYAKDDLNHAA